MRSCRLDFVAILAAVSASSLFARSPEGPIGFEPRTVEGADPPVLGVFGVEPGDNERLTLAGDSTYSFIGELPTDLVTEEFVERQTSNVPPGKLTFGPPASMMVFPIFYRAGVPVERRQPFSEPTSTAKATFIENGKEDQPPRFQSQRIAVRGELKTPPAGDWLLEFYVTPLPMFYELPDRLRDEEGRQTSDLVHRVKVTITPKADAVPAP